MADPWDVQDTPDLAHSPADRAAAEALSRRLDELLAPPGLRAGVAPGESTLRLGEFAGRVVAALQPPPVDAAARERRRARLERGVTGRRFAPPSMRCAAWAQWMRRPAWTAAACVVLALALTGVTYAALTISPLLQQVWRRDPGAAHVDQASLARDLALAHTANGVTVRLERAYADANRIVIGYTIDVPAWLAADHGGIQGEAVLTDAAGRTFAPRGGQGQRDAGARLGAYVLSFDAAALPANGRTASFRLTISEIRAIRIGGGTIGEQPTPVVVEQEAGATTLRLSPAGQQQVQVPGPWSFEFTLPVVPGTVVEPRQGVTAGGVAVHLERLVITPSEVRAYLRFNPPDRERYPDWFPVAQIESPGGGPAREPQMVPISGGGTGDAGQWVLSFPAAVSSPRGTWTLHITELVGMADPNRPGWETDGLPRIAQRRLAGPWVFKVAVP